MNKLSVAPIPGSAVDCGGVPPEWIEPARRLIELVERPVDGIDQSLDGTVEGSMHSKEDWNSRLGFPNTVHSPTTSPRQEPRNGTSAAMVFERVGASRQAVLAACERKMGLTEESTEEQKAARVERESRGLPQKKKIAGGPAIRESEDAPRHRRLERRWLALILL